MLDTRLPKRVGRGNDEVSKHNISAGVVMQKPIVRTKKISNGYGLTDRHTCTLG